MSDYAKLIKKMHSLEREVITESFKKGNIKLNESDDYDFSDIDDRTLKGLLAELKKLRKQITKLQDENEDLRDEIQDLRGVGSSSSSGCHTSSSSSYSRSHC